MTLKQDGPIFFFSYARADADDHLGRFFQNLREEVRSLLGLPADHPVGFRDTHGIKTGDRWPEELSSALSTCQILLPLYSRSFFNSEYCGKEWSAFRSRLDAHGSNPRLILPILWKPLGASFERLPKEIRDIQYSFADLGETYRNEGLQYLLRLDEQKDSYQKFLVAFAKRIVDASDSSPLEPANPPLDIENFPNAFTEPEPAPVIDTTTARSSKRTRGYYMPKASKDLEPSFIEIRDDFLARLERVCRLREPSAQIERISGEGDSWDYLRVSVRHGDIVRDYPVTGVEYDVSLEDLDAFCEQIDKGFRGADPRMISYLIYGGAPAPEGLQSVATKRDVRLMSLIEYMGLIDFRSYLRKQTDDLTRDKLYPPSLYVTQRMVSLERNEEHPDALAKLQEWLSTPNRRFAVILGDFGTGKTFLLHELARRMGLLESGPVPILLQMRSLEKGRTLAQLLGQHFGQNEPEGYRFERFRYMLEQGRIVLLFDGFDELALRVTYDRAAEHFETLLSAAQGDAKIVVTSRRQHFISDQQVRSKLGEEVGLISGSRLGILQTFGREQIRTFLVNRCGSDAEAEARLTLIDSIKDLLGLSENPRMLGFIADLPERQLRDAAAGGEITAATLYRLILERWLVHEFERVHPKGAPPGLSVQERWNAVTLLAVRLWQKTERFVNLGEIQADAAEAIRKLDSAFDEAMAAFQVGSGTLLVRDEGGNFSFLHQSILEFLVAQAIAEEIKGEGSSPLLDQRDLSLLMIDFLTSLAERENIISWVRVAALGDDELAKKNALLVLDRLGEPLGIAVNLSGQDLSGQDFSGQDLTGAVLERANLSSAKLIKTRFHSSQLAHSTLRDADLTHADLSQADLAYANLSRARLLGADLRGADLVNAIFERAKLIGSSLEEIPGSADFLGAALQVPPLLEGTLPFYSDCSAVAWNPKRDLLASAEGSLVRLWDPSTGQLIRALQGHQGHVTSVVFSPDGNTLASASDDHTVRLWDTRSERETRILRGHEAGVNAVVFSSEGTILASTAGDNTLRVWDTESGKELRAEWHLGGVSSVAFNPNGNEFASASWDNTVRLRNIPSSCIEKTV
ncbi:MAG TPA: TIR-like protein FxsC [Thermoanaerobaculia bacterium]